MKERISQNLCWKSYYLFFNRFRRGFFLQSETWKIWKLRECTVFENRKIRWNLSQEIRILLSKKTDTDEDFNQIRSFGHFRCEDPFTAMDLKFDGIKFVILICARFNIVIQLEYNTRCEKGLQITFSFTTKSLGFVLATYCVLHGNDEALLTCSL